MQALLDGNPLAFPGRRPGFDPTHPAARGCRFSGIAAGGNFVSLLSGKAGSIGGTPTATIDGALGPSLAVGTGTTNASSFSGQSTVNDASATIAAIVRFNAVSTNQGLFSTSTTNAGWRLVLTNLSGEILAMTAGSVANNSFNGFTPVAGVPYFIAAVGSAAACRLLVLRLDNGKIITSSISGSSANAPNGTYEVGNNSFGQPANANIAAAMFTAQALSLPQLLAWASDPWAFWYPRNVLHSLDWLSAPVSATAIFQDAFFGKESLTVVQRDNAVKLETLATLQQDRLFSIEALASLVTDRLVYLEHLTGQTQDTSVSEEHISALIEDSPSLSEHLSSLQQDSPFRLESEGVLFQDNLFRLEGQASVVQDNTVLEERLALLNQDAKLSSESLGGLSQDSSFSGEHLTTISPDNPLRLETSASLAQIFGLSLENLSSLSQDNPFRDEHLAEVDQLVLVGAEALALLEQASPLLYEVLSTAVSIFQDAGLSLEVLVQTSSDSPLSAEALGGVQQDAQLFFEWLLAAAPERFLGDQKMMAATLASGVSVLTQDKTKIILGVGLDTLGQS